MLESHQFRSTAQTVRVLTLLDALSAVGLTPASAQALHEVAYLANVLAPVFDLPPLDATLLKRKAGPYYPELQQTIDILVGQGLVEAIDLRYELDEVALKHRIVASYRLRRVMCSNALSRYRQIFHDEAMFLDELAAAYSCLAERQQGRAALLDAHYADKATDVNNVIDFGEWVSAEKNFSRNAAMSFAPGRALPPAERLFLYLDHLQKKVTHAR